MSSKGISFAPPRGMRDFYPEDMVIRNFLFDSWTGSARRFGFSQYDACVVESMDLLTRKAGEEIAEQIYTFKDKSDRDLALRPEMTPSLARLIAARQGSLSFPLKWFSTPQCFRYERTTRGRKREHYQWNLDIVGDQSVFAEAEVISCAVDAISSLGIDRQFYKVRFNNRRLLSSLLAAYNIPREQHSSVFLALDKKGKVPDDKIREILKGDGVPDATLEKIDEMSSIQSLDDVASMLSANDALDETTAFLEAADAFGISDVIEFDLSVIRGLAYYTGIVFEAFDAKGKLRAIFGGGRYDNLLSTIGGSDITAVGLGFGDVVITELMQELNCSPSLTSTESLIVGFMEERQRLIASRVATAFRGKGQDVYLAPRTMKPKAFFKTAGDGSYRQAVYIGPDDLASEKLKLKDLSSREETEVAISDILSS